MSQTIQGTYYLNEVRGMFRVSEKILHNNDALVDHPRFWAVLQKVCQLVCQKTSWKVSMWKS